MAIFQILVTRDTTETVTLDIRARSKSEACRKAMEKACTEAGLPWTPDDDSGLQSDPYITGVNRIGT